MAKVIGLLEAASLIEKGHTVLFGGFLAVGCAQSIIDTLVKEGTGELGMIVIATDYDDKGVGKLISNRQVRKVTASHIGTNKATQKLMNDGELEVDLVPQGTLLEQIRSAGSGLGGVLTPTGLGTVVAEGKRVIKVDGKEYLLEKPLGGDVALLRAYKADKHGNLIYRKTARNSNPVMATAAKTTIVEVDEIVKIGELGPEEIVTPGIFVDYLVITKKGGV